MVSEVLADIEIRLVSVEPCLRRFEFSNGTLCVLKRRQVVVDIDVDIHTVRCSLAQCLVLFREIVDAFVSDRLRL